MNLRATTDTVGLPETQALQAFVARQAFPCLGAKAAVARQSLRVLRAGDLGEARHDQAVVHAIQQFAGEQSDEALFVSLVVIFDEVAGLTEAGFEQALWRRLQAWHEIDRCCFDWDPRVSADPASPRFSMSLGGKAFYVIGLHPASSRAARRFRQPALVLNLHSQFEQLRADGRYQKLRDAIGARDIAFSGSRNPMLAEHGRASAAPQYSGRQVDADWVCPFHAHGGPR